MENTRTSRLHPLLTAAAISLIVFSAVGVAALTGVMPSTKSASELELPKEIIKPIEPAISHPVEAPKPVARKKLVVKSSDSEFKKAEVKKPVVIAGLLGTVETVREVEVAGDSKGVGAVAGGVAGAVLGHNIGGNNKLVTILGTAGGALLGNHIEKRKRATRHWELTVRFDDGTTQVMSSEAQPFWRQGDRVRLLDGKLQPV